MNSIVAKNVREFLKATGRKDEWVVNKSGIDETSLKKLMDGEEEGLLHLEKFATLFGRETQEFYKKEMELPLTIEQIRKEHEYVPLSDIIVAISDAEDIQINLNQAYGWMLEGEQKENSPLFEEVKELLTGLKAKTKLFLEENEKKYYEKELK